jgi:hypothetical protein
LITNDSSGTGTNSVAMNPPPGGSWPTPDPHSDWRSEKFATVPGETVEFSFDFKFIDVVSFPEFQEFRIELRSFGTEDETGGFAGEQTLRVSPVGYNLTGTPVMQDFSDGQWHTLGFTRVIPSVEEGAAVDGLFSDVRVSINAFTSLTEGQVRIDNVSVVRPVEGLPGDYNGNGMVDAADYVAWRDNLDQSVTLPNDTTPGMVTQEDYDVWRANFGASAPGAAGGSLSNAAVPEPSCLLLMLMATAWHPRRRASVASHFPG